MGKEITDGDRNKEAWDSNAITPGTPFMDLLASSLRYWIVQKINTDPGWKKVSCFIEAGSYVRNVSRRCRSSFPMLVFLERGSTK
jgi:5'-3' exoribonuclease 2